MENVFDKGEGSSFWVLGDLYTFKITGKQTNGAFTVVDQMIQPNSGPPPHIHHSEDEAFYIVNGKFSFLLGDRKNTLQSGDFVYVPKGTIHTFRNIGEESGKLLVIITPAGLEEFFYSIGVPAKDMATPAPVDHGIMEKIMQLSKKYKMEIVVPAKD